MTSTYYPELNESLVKIIQDSLLKWWNTAYKIREKREFFWRNWILNERKPTVMINNIQIPRDFGIFCVETVLRMTRAENVEVHFPPFFHHFQSFKDIISASYEQLYEVLKPLGRVKQNVPDLRKRSQIIVEKYNSKVPKSKFKIRNIMETGKRNRHIYFVEAVALYIHEIYGAPVDVNVERIYVKLFKIKRKKYGVQDDREFCEFASYLVPKDDCIEYNLALLDLGALICTRGTPKCIKCPLRKICLNSISSDTG